MKIYAVCSAVLIAESGAAVLPAEAPIAAINVYLNGFHFYNRTFKVKWKRIATAPTSTRNSSIA